MRSAVRSTVTPSASSSSSARPCDQCGATGSIDGVLGCPVCAECGTILSFPTLADQPYSARLSASSIGNGPLLRATMPPGSKKDRLKAYTASLNRVAQHASNTQRLRVAIARVGAAHKLQLSVVEPSLSLMMRHCNRKHRYPRQGKRLKCLASACVLIISNRMGLGVTPYEIAAKAELPLGIIQKQIWRVCMGNGVRFARNAQNTEALLARVCDSLNLTFQRKAVCNVALRLVKIAEAGWMATGRHWVYIAAAAFFLAARTYYFQLEYSSLSKVMYISKDTLHKKVLDLKRIILSIVQVLPWSKMITFQNLHIYLHFVVEHFEILAPAAALYRQQITDEVEAEAPAPIADGPKP